MAEKSSWDQANIQRKLGLVWKNIKKICQIITGYFYLPFFLLIILCFRLTLAVLWTKRKLAQHTYACTPIFSCCTAFISWYPHKDKLDNLFGNLFQTTSARA
jgi:hypothetical protein